MDGSFAKKECVAMLLAGGQGSRLYVLTENIAKPAVPFGGKYRIIDFTLSNCVNSEIDTVGVLTQYQPLELNSYIGNGQPWDLDRLYGGVSILPPHIKGKTAEWYKGTANAIYQNLSFIEQYNAEYVLVLSGDHIYTMNYGDMLTFHKENNADCTIAVIEVPKEECSRFGIMNVNSDDSIYEFEEKPKMPKSNLASMGIYIFTYKKLREYLVADENTPRSKNDFGGDVIPAMLQGGERMMAYRFSGYWKDVGTIDSLWEAHMDLLGKSNGFEFLNSDWPIYARTTTDAPHFMGNSSSVTHSLITAGCEIDGTVENSVLFNSVSVDTGARVSYSIVMPGSVIEEGAIVEYAIIAENAVIKRGAHVGAQPKNINPESWGIAVVASGITVSENARVMPRQMIDKDI